MIETKPTTAEVRQIGSGDKRLEPFETFDILLPINRHWQMYGSIDGAKFTLYRPEDQELISISAAALGEIVRRHPELAETVGAFTNTVRDALADAQCTAETAARPTEPVESAPGANRIGQI